MKSFKKHLALFALAALCSGAIAFPPKGYFCYKACDQEFLKGTPDYQQCIANCDEIYGT